MYGYVRKHILRKVVSIIHASAVEYSQKTKYRSWSNLAGKYRASSSSYSYHKRSRFIVFVVICYNQFREITRKTCDSIVIHESLNTKAVLYWQQIIFLLRTLYLIHSILWGYGTSKRLSLKINCSNIKKYLKIVQIPIFS